MKVLTVSNEKNKITFILCTIFIISIIFRSVLAISYAEPNVWYDELLHWKMGESIIQQGNISFRGQTSSRTSILYSIFIALVHFIPDNFLAQDIAQIMNAILMSSVVFPIYLMSNTILESKKWSIIIVVIGILIPEMEYTGKILQENLFYPLMMWYFYFFIKYIKSQEFRLRSLAILVGINLLLYTCKDTGLGIFLGAIIYYIFIGVIDKKNRLNSIKEVILYIIGFISITFLYGKGFILLNSVQIGNVEGNNILMSSLNKLLNINIIVGAIYPVITYGVIIAMLWGILPIIVPLSMLESMEYYKKKIICLIGSIFIACIGMIYITIITAENPGDMTIRIHYRYLFYLFIPTLIIFIDCYNKIREELNVKIYSILIGMYVVIIAIVDIVYQKGAHIDAPSLLTTFYFSFSEASKVGLKILVIIYLLTVTIYVYKEKIRVVYGIVLSVMVGCMLINTYIVYTSDEKANKNYVVEAEDKIKQINNYIAKNDKGIKKEDLLLVATHSPESLALLEVFINYPYILTVDSFFYDSIKDGTGQIDFTKIELFGFHQRSVDQKLKAPKYILSDSTLPLDGYECVLQNKMYNLYKINSSNIGIRYINGQVYDDRWLGDNYSIKFFGKGLLKRITLKLNTGGHVPPVEIVYRDGSGNEGNITVGDEIKDYTISVHRSDESEPFELELIPMSTFVPKNLGVSEDERELSVLLHDFKID